MKRTSCEQSGAHKLHAAIGIIIVAAVLTMQALMHFGVITGSQLAAFFRLSEKPVSDDLSAHFVDVGQGDCELIVCNGEACLIDCGEQDMASKVKGYLSQQGIGSLKYLIISHQHTDHMGSAADILEYVKVDKVIMPDIPDELIPTNTVYEDFLDAAERLGAQIYTAKEETLELGGCELHILPQSFHEEYESLNDYSLCVKAVYKNVSFLFTGDAENAEEQNILQSGFDISADVLKVGHHGSSGSCSDEFLSAVGAEYAVIEVGVGNDYGHPAKSLLSRLEKHCKHIYRTDINGSVVIRTDGENIEVRCEKEDANYGEREQ